MDFAKYDEYLLKEATVIWVVFGLMAVILLSAIIYFVPKAVKAKTKNVRRENAWVAIIVSAFLVPFMIYAIFSAVGVHTDVKGQLYETYEGEFDVSIYYASKAGYKVDIYFYELDDTVTYDLYPDAVDKLDSGVYDGYIVYSKNSGYIFDWGEGSPHDR